MIFQFKCPLCNEIHNLLAQALVEATRKPEGIPFVCPVKRGLFYIKVQVIFQGTKEITSGDIARAEMEAELADERWKEEEGR